MDNQIKVLPKFVGVMSALFICWMCVVVLQESGVKWLRGVQLVPIKAQAQSAKIVESTQEQVAIFADCSNTWTAGSNVQGQANNWLKQHPTVTVVEREMQITPCSRFNNMTSATAPDNSNIAIVMTLHYR